MIKKVTVFHYRTSKKYGYIVRYQSNKVVSLLEGVNKIPKTVIDFVSNHEWHLSEDGNMKNISVFRVF